MVSGIASQTAYPSDRSRSTSYSALDDLSLGDRQQLQRGEILLETRSHTDWGAGVTARMYLPTERAEIWQALTCYSRWVAFFPDLTHSEVVEDNGHRWKRLHQSASKNFVLFQINVSIYLKVFETALNDYHLIRFRMEEGNFRDFSADLHLEDWNGGTVLTYSVQATPTVPIPSMFIQQAIRLDLPANLKQMRRCLTQASAIA
ncbi:MAG: SRPBCC family protein [Cyanobacteria bacterium J06638_22]